MERSNTVFGDEYLKTKTRSYNNKITINFQNGMSNSANPTTEGSKYIFLSAIVIESLFKSSKNYYPHTFLEK